MMPSAWAQTIAVVRPNPTDRMLVETSSRVCGELRMYGFMCTLVAGDDGLAAPSSDRVGVQGDASVDVIGGVTFLRTPLQASASIWIVEKTSRKKSVRLTVSVDNADAPFLLAIRTADVLRAYLLDRNRIQEAQAAPSPLTPAATSSQREGPGPSATRDSFDRWTVRAGVVLLWETGRLGPGFAPTIQVERRVHPRLSVAFAFTGPARGQEYISTMATARVGIEVGTLAIAWRLVAHRHFSLDILQSIGGAHFSVHGEAQPPWIAQSASAWAVAASTGARVTLLLSEHLGLGADLAAFFALPRPVFEVAEATYAARQPFLLATAGFSYGF